MSLCREKDRCVHYAVCKLCRCVAGAWVNHHHVKQLSRTDTLCLLQRPDALIPCDFGDSMHKVSRLSKARVHHLCIIGIYRCHMCEAIHKPLCNILSLFKTTEGACNSHSYGAIRNNHKPSVIPFLFIQS